MVFLIIFFTDAWSQRQGFGLLWLGAWSQRQGYGYSGPDAWLLWPDAWLLWPDAWSQRQGCGLLWPDAWSQRQGYGLLWTGISLKIFIFPIFVMIIIIYP